MGRVFTIIALCGYVMLPTGAARGDDTQVAKTVLELGGRVGWRNAKKTLTFARAASQLPKALQVVHVDLFHCQSLKAADLAGLRGLPNLEQLNLGYSRVTDDGLKHIAVLPKLTELYLGSTKITDAGLKALMPLKKLECLDLSGTGVSDAGLKLLSELSLLSRVFLSRTKVTAAGLETFGSAELKVLHLQGLPLTSAQVGKLSRWKNLEELSLTPTETDLKPLADLQNLRKLTLHGNGLTDDAIESLASVKQLERLHFSQTNLTDFGFKQVRQTLPKANLTARPLWSQSAFLGALSPNQKVLRWRPGTTTPAWPGLAFTPAKLPGIGRWQVESKAPRTAIVDADWHPNGKLVALATLAGHVRIYEAIDGGFRLKVLRPAHIRPTRSVKWNPAGTRLASGGMDKRLCIWDTEGKLVRELKGHGGAIVAVDWSPDGKRLLAAGSIEFRIWNADDGSAGPVVRTTGHQIGDVAWDPQGEFIATAGSDKTVRIWNASDGKTVATWKGHTDRVTTLAWSPNGKTLASGSWDKTVRLWTRDGKTLKVAERHRGRVEDVCWNTNGATFATIAGSWLHWYDAKGEPLPGKPRKHTSDFRCVDVNPQDSTVLTGTFGDSQILRWEENGKVIAKYGDASVGIGSVAWHPDSRRLATGGWDRLVRLWDADGKQEFTLPGHTGRVKDLEYSPDGETLASAGDKTLRLWSGALPVHIGEKHTQALKAVAWHPAGDRLVTSDFKGLVVVWTADGQVLKTCELPGSVERVDWNADGSRFLACGANRMFKLLSPDAQALSDVDGLSGSVLTAQWSPDGRHLVSGGWSQRIRILDSNGNIKKELAPRAAILHVTWAPDSTKFASALADGRLQINAADGKRLKTIFAHPSRIQRAAWSSDGRRIASGTFDGTLRIWNVETGELERLTMMFKDGQYATFSPAGQLIDGDRRYLRNELVYVVEDESGRPQLVPPAEFQKNLRGSTDAEF